MSDLVPTFFDTHGHLDYPEFQADFEAVLDRARAAGIRKLVSVGTDFDSSRRAVALADRHPEVYAVVGWHPSHAHEAPDDLRPTLRGLAAHPKVIAIGETGMDYHWLPSRHGKGSAEDDARHCARQADILTQQLEVAAETGLNVVIHQRDCFADLVAHVAPWMTRIKAVFHCFGEGPERLRQLLELGCFVSFTGIVTFKNGQSVRESAAAVPSGRFMLETDCPYLAPVPYRGKRSEPAHVKETAATIAQARGCSLEELSRMTCAAAEDFFPRLKGA